MPSSRFSGRYRRGNSAVGWAKVRSSRAVPTISLSTRVEKMGTLPPSLFDLRRTSRFVSPYDFALVAIEAACAGHDIRFSNNGDDS
ncbi:hypothetical protein ACVWZR_007819 [Bradyrhizobium sp. i1.3.1]